MYMRYCLQCHIEKEYHGDDVGHRVSSKTIGFHGRICYDCYRLNYNAKNGHIPRTLFFKNPPSLDPEFERKLRSRESLAEYFYPIDSPHQK
jgi:hypothetical protein